MAKIGRPQSPRGGKKGILLTVRISVAERDFLAHRAETLGVTLADLQRDRLLFDMPAYQIARTVDAAIGGPRK